VELATAFGTSKSGGVIVAAIAAVFTIGYVANMLGETKTGCTTSRSTCSPKTDAFTSTASATMA
jgi:hypothetical protein